MRKLLKRKPGQDVDAADIMLLILLIKLDCYCDLAKIARLETGTAPDQGISKQAFTRSSAADEPAVWCWSAVLVRVTVKE